MSTASPAPAEPDAEVAAVPPPNRRRKLLLIGGGVAVLLLAAGGGAFALMGGGGEAEHEAAEAPAEGEKGAAITPIELPEMVVNLRTPDGAPRFVKLKLMLLPAKAGLDEELTARIPLLVDGFQPYLRELRPRDLAGSAAVFRLKEELMLRAEEVFGPGKVADILVQDMIQQ